MISRRGLLAGGLAAVAFRDETLDLVERLVGRFEGAPDDEDFWLGIQQAFALDRNVVNFNNGGCSPSPRVVQEVLRRQLEFSNQGPSHYMWRYLEPEVENVRTRLARLYGCDPEEMAITRNASESLEAILFGLDLQSGDEILTTNLDYPRMIQTIQQRERREGIRMVQARMPAVPKSHRELIDPIERAITDRTKLLLVSQVSFLNGQIFPIKEIVALGHRRGVPVCVDGAHAFVQFACDYGDLDCDFYGASLHKWLMAPIGTGLLHVKKARIPPPSFTS
ncbi:aminotransferase class V-fold PLP-dependent enzyme, partial [bacterium]